MASLGGIPREKIGEKEQEKEVFNRDMNAHSAIDISKRIVGLFPITSKNIFEVFGTV